MHSENVWFDTPTMSGTRVFKGSKVIPYMASMGVDLWPLHWPISGHCTYGKLIPLFNLHSSPINLSPFSIKIGPFWKFDPYTKGRWPFPYFSLYLDNETSYGYHALTFLLLMTRERIWDIFQPNWIILKFYPHITFDLDFMVKMLFEKMPGMFVW